MAFKYVRFFSLSVPTSSKRYNYEEDILGMHFLDKISGPGNWSYRTGRKNQEGELTSRQEVDYRLEQMKECLSRMTLYLETNTLSIFMCPEFYLQGPKGVIEYADVARFYEGVQTAINENKLNKCLIVPGTTIVKSENQSGEVRTHNIIALFFDNKIYVGVKINTSGIDIIDKNRSGYWQHSGEGFIAGEAKNIDLADNSLESKDFKRVLNSIKDEMQSEKRNLIRCTQPYIDIGATLGVGGIRVGWEICLDHSQHELRNSIGDWGYKCNIQLIPSCGMQPVKGSLFLRKNGIFFNVDGAKSRMGSRVKRGDIKLANRIYSSEVILGRVGSGESKHSYVVIDNQTRAVTYVNCNEITIGGLYLEAPISDNRALLKWSDVIQI